MKILKYFFIILAPLWIIGISTRIVFNEWFIDYEYSKKDFPKDRWNLDDEYRKHLAKLGLEAVLSEEGLKEFSEAKLPNGVKAFREKEIKHMKDVNKFLKFFFPLTYLAFFIWFLGFFLWKDSSYLIYSGVFTIFLIVFIGSLIIIFYEEAFAFFHDTVFGRNTWRFRQTDTLLRIYPMKFWFDGTVFVIGLSLFISLGLIGIGILRRKLFEKGL
ncbi:MAG: TIGR01906 family membrane protein [Aquificae bacterium]|nr:TIGR01906 family membrane protein [Aquificota bacterium]